jgi:histidyl-tRNA synthetase
LRILDSKDEKDQEILKEAPSLLHALSDTSKRKFDQVQEALSALEIPFKLDDRLVRGLDYYSDTVFEFVSSSLGAQGAVLAGGRYDGLVKSMGGPAVPAVG